MNKNYLSTNGSRETSRMPMSVSSWQFLKIKGSDVRVISQIKSLDVFVADIAAKSDMTVSLLNELATIAILKIEI